GMHRQRLRAGDGTPGRWLQQRAGFLRGERYLSGGVYLALGVTTAVSGSGTD
nr:hypothetical protein [Acidothermales bacterium]